MYQQTTLRWILVFAGLAALVYMLQGILTPFIVSLIVAYALNPLVVRMTHIKIPRAAAAAIIVLLFVMALVLIIVSVAPLIQVEILSFVKKAPLLTKRLVAFIDPLTVYMSEYVTPEDLTRLKNFLTNSLGDSLLVIARLVASLLSNGLALANVISLTIITPILSFYMLKDWEVIVHKTSQLIPPAWHKTVTDVTMQIDDTMAGFARGQAFVCFMMAIFYSLGLSIIGLDFALIIGIGAGFLTCIPYVGLIVGLISAAIVAAMQFATWLGIVKVLIVFVCGMAIEAYYLVPRFVGNRIGLHPVWIIFAVLAGAHFQGFVGILIALPFAAIMGVLIRFGIDRYKKSALYGAQF